MLSILIFLPFFAISFVILMPQTAQKWHRNISGIAISLQMLVCIYLYVVFSVKQPLLFQEKYDWITIAFGSFGKISIDYFVGLDGLNAVLVLLAGIVIWVGWLLSWNVKEKSKSYFSLFLLLSGSIFGCLLALDFFLFFLFFEMMLLPMYFLIGLWGGKNRNYASLKFLIYTLLGSLFILLGVIVLALSISETPNGEVIHSFDMLLMKNEGNYLKNSILHTSSTFLFAGQTARWWVFVLILVGFLIKLPSVPFHTWLPDAHVEASTPISVVLAGILLKIGGYGILRTCIVFFPEVAISFSQTMAIVGAVSIIYGAMNALAQTDFKKMVAYSSVSHMGFVLLGVASLTQEGVQGAVFQMFSHGVLSAMLFVIVGVLYDRTQNRNIDDYQGLISRMPLYGGFATVAFFASLGLPAFSGFIGEFFTLFGAFQSKYVPVWVPILASLGILLGAGYFLWVLQKMFLGIFWVRNPEILNTHLIDLNIRETIVLSILALLTFTSGIFPSWVFQKIWVSLPVF